MASVCLIGLIAPAAGFEDVQPVVQRIAIGNFGRRDQNRMEELGTAVDPDVRLHAKVPLLALGRLVHLGVSLAVTVFGRTRHTDHCRIDDLDLDAPYTLLSAHNGNLRDLFRRW